MQQVQVIAIDGPSAAGKGTVSVLTARYLHWHILPSGLFYRCLAHLARVAGISEDQLANQTEAIVDLVPSLKPQFRTNPAEDETLQVLLQGQDITTVVMQDTIGELAGKMSALPRVRAALVATQRDFRRAPGLVAEGRDMGTVIFPDAFLKIFLTADIRVRAARRLKQLRNYGETYATIESVLDAMQKRDARDAERAAAPLKKAADAIVLDTAHDSPDQIARRILELAKVKI